MIITFIPHHDFTQTAKTLKDTHLNQSSVSALKILRSLFGVYPLRPRTQTCGWETHTIGLFWKGHEYYLTLYMKALYEERAQRAKEKNNLESYNKFQQNVKNCVAFLDIMDYVKWPKDPPELLNDEEFHSGMRAHLKYKEIQSITFKNWQKGMYSSHPFSRTLLPKRKSWRREDYIHLWEIFGRPEPVWYNQWNWAEEPDDLKMFFSEDRVPQMLKEIRRKELYPITGYLDVARQRLKKQKLLQIETPSDA